MIATNRFIFLTILFVVAGIASGLIFNVLQQRRDTQGKTDLLKEIQRRHQYQLEMLSKSKSRIRSLIKKSDSLVVAPQKTPDSTYILLNKCVFLLAETEHMIDELLELRESDSTLIVTYGAL